MDWSRFLSRRHRWSRFALPIAAAMLVMLAWAPPAAAQNEQDLDLTAESLTDDHVQGAIDSIVAELYRRKDRVNFWEPDRLAKADLFAGYTALVTLSLLYAGESYQNPQLADAISFLQDAEMFGTYPIAIRAQVWALLPDKFNEDLEEDTKWLLHSFSPIANGWNYTKEPATTRIDNSLTQYGALALWEAAKRGVKVPDNYWQRLEQRFLDTQVVDGGWNYSGTGVSTGSMTAAGLATLFITQEYLHQDDYLTIGTRGNMTPNEQAMADGLSWMIEHFVPDDNPSKFVYYFYYMYAVERVGLASGRKTFGQVDWFRAGAAELINRVCEWDPVNEKIIVKPEQGGGAENSEGTPESKLAFTLMFLSRGRVPVGVNKLAVEGMPWNNRPRDAAHLARHLLDSSELRVSWQIVSMDTEPEEWLDAPLLYFASHVPVPWLADREEEVNTYIRAARAFHEARRTGEVAVDADAPAAPDIAELNKLKRYIDLGGLVLAVSEGATTAFAESMEKAGSVMYPEYEWRTLTRDHWAYNLLWPVRKSPPKLRALSNGVRELMIVSHADLSRTLQGQVYDDEHTAVASNIYLYASEKFRLRPRLAEHSIEATQLPSDAREVKIVRAIHAGDWDVEPEALPLFASYMSRKHNLQVYLEDVPLEQIDKIAPRPAAVIVSGVERVEFTEPQQQAMQQYVEAGGVLLFETPGGNGRFTLDAELMASRLFRKPIRNVRRSRIVTGEELPGAVPLDRIEYRPYALESFGSREITPRLRGMRFGDDARVLFSREDISHGLLDQPCWGISGYAPSAARDLLANLVLYGAQVNR